MRCELSSRPAGLAALGLVYLDYPTLERVPKASFSVPRLVAATKRSAFETAAAS